MSKMVKKNENLKKSQKITLKKKNAGKKQYSLSFAK